MPGAAVWNQCFTREGVALGTPLSLVVLDADWSSIDDVIGTACTTAASGERWLELTGPTAASTSKRGRVRVRIFLFGAPTGGGGGYDGAAGGAGAALPADPQWTTVESAPVTPVAGARAASVTVGCPSGLSIVGCQCATEGEPGCASARIELRAGDDSPIPAWDGVLPGDGRLERPLQAIPWAEVCRATALSYEPPAPLPPCPGRRNQPSHGGGGPPRLASYDYDDGDADGQVPTVTCAPAGWTAPQPAPIRASARCARVVDASETTSPPSRASYNDATVAHCGGGGRALLSCSQASDGGALGTKVEDEDSNGQHECVAYAAGGASATAQARCARMESAASMAAYGRTSLTLPITGHSGALRMPGKAAAHWLLARCPAPFRLSGCGCYSSYKNCLGAAFDTAGADSCNVTQRIPRA